MSDTFNSLLLGAVQGIAEFLPISSSGHLALLEVGLDLSYVDLSFIAVVHLGTFLAVAVYFWKDLLTILKTLPTPHSLGWKLVVATIPAGAAGFLLGDALDTLIQTLLPVGIALLLTGALLLLIERHKKRHSSTKKDASSPTDSLATLSYKDALLIGTAQIFALMPGISRSGATMAAGLARHLSREDSVRFSFLLSLPIVFGAGLLSVLQLLTEPEPSIATSILLIGFCSAFFVGLATIHFFLKHIRTHTFVGYGIYALLLGAGTVAWHLFVS